MRPVFAVLTLLIIPYVGVAADIPATGTGGKDKAARKIATLIDRHLFADWQARHITPAPMADDAEFCRRVYLDLIGRIPKVSEVRAFAADTNTDKRWKLVEALLAKPGYANHLAAAMRASWLPETITDPFKTFLGEQYEAYLRRKLSANVPLTQIVKETLTAEVAIGPRGRIALNNPEQSSDTQALQFFYQALDAKPENLGATVTRAFLGVKLECAQCHDHPFAPYSRTQFWQFAAFFGEFTPLPPVGPSFVGPLPAQYTKNRISVPGLGKGGTTKQVSATFLDGSAPAWSEQKAPRQELADWIQSPNNPYFARNLVNRLWHQYFGIGLIDPLDEPGDNNPPSHPELLDDLAKAAIDSDFDLRVLAQGIMGSQAYQLTSRLTHPTQSDPRRFARMNMKGLTGAQIINSFVTATGVRTDTGLRESFTFRTLFPIPAKPTETQTSILQALTVMNGKLTADQTSIERSDALAAIADAPFLTTEKKIEALFLTTLTRKPTPEEKETLASYVDRGGPSGNKEKVLADVFWVLLNSTEFLFNH
jgi:hypothetical protein